MKNQAAHQCIKQAVGRKAEFTPADSSKENEQSFLETDCHGVLVRIPGVKCLNAQFGKDTCGNSSLLRKVSRFP